MIEKTPTIPREQFREMINDLVRKNSGITISEWHSDYSVYVHSVMTGKTLTITPFTTLGAITKYLFGRIYGREVDLGQVELLRESRVDYLEV